MQNISCFNWKKKCGVAIYSNNLHLEELEELRDPDGRCIILKWDFQEAKYTWYMHEVMLTLIFFLEFLSNNGRLSRRFLGHEWFHPKKTGQAMFKVENYPKIYFNAWKCWN